MDEIFAFSHALEQFPVLYDKKVRNQKFSENFKGMGSYIQNCYGQLAAQLGITAEEAKKKCIKYVDSMTKALAQLKDDLICGTSVCPVPAMHKLHAFRFLWPHSKHYDEELMKDVVFDHYLERALQVEVNRLTRAKEDAASAQVTLSLVQEYNTTQAFAALDLKSACESDCDPTVFDDASCFEIVEMQSCCEATYSICAYLPLSRDPTFNFAVQGFQVYDDSVTIDVCVSGKCTRKRADPFLLSLKSCGESASRTRQLLRCAQGAENAFVDALAALFGHDVVSMSTFVQDEALTDEHSLVQLQSGVVRSLSVFHKFVIQAVDAAKLYADVFEELKTASRMTSVSPLRSQCAIDDICKLRALRAKSKRFSSDSWTCVLLQQL